MNEKPKNFRRVIKAAYKKSEQAKLDALLAEQRRWSRKTTIALNKLEAARRAIDAYTAQLVKEKDGTSEPAQLVA